MARSIDSLRARAAHALECSIRNVRPLQWVGSGGDSFTVELTADRGDELAVVGHGGSALIKVDNRPYFELDNYHRTIPLPSGRHEVSAEFVGYAAFGERVAINPGKPYLINRDHDALRFWAHVSSALELAQAVGDDEAREALLDAVDDAFKLVPFTSVSRDQIMLANELYGGIWWGERAGQFMTDELNDVYAECRGLDYGRALSRLKDSLGELARRFGKRGTAVGLGHAHIDAAWLWNFDEARRKVLRTFSTVVSLMKIFDFTYMQSSALYYEWALEDDPGLFEDIRRLVREGRWILGAGWVEPDGNMLGGESWARQMLYSQRFYIKHFGKAAEVLWLPDTFGFAATVPSIAAQSKVKAFATHKVFWNDTNRFPHGVFDWIAPNGDGVAAVAFGNGKGGYNGDFTVKSVLEQWRGWSSKDQPMLYSYGYGDGGGGPTAEMILRAEAINDLPILPRIDLGKGIKYFQELRPAAKWRGYLYLEAHRGTLTSHSKMKRLHRMAEVALRDAELWSALAGTYEPNKFARLWLTLLKDQFHDVLPGSAIKEVYQTAYGELEGVIREANEAAGEAIGRAAGEGEALLVFNSLPWDRADYVTVDYEAPNSQRVEGGFLVLVESPGIGYSTLKPVKPERPATIFKEEGGYALDNGLLRVRLGMDGSALEIRDLINGRDVLRGEGNVLMAYENAPGWADAWDIEPNYQGTGFRLRAVESRILHEGPLLVGVRFVYRFRRSEAIQDVLLYADKPRLDFKTTLRLVDRELLYKAWFPLDVNADEAVSDTAFGVVNWPLYANTSWEAAKFEVPIQKWIDLSEHDYGVALLNDGKYAASLKGPSVGLTLAKTPMFPDPASDLEESTFTYSLYPHGGDWRAAQVHRRAWELNSPMRTARGRQGEATLLGVRGDNLMVEAVKGGEDGGGELIIRLYELYNERGAAELVLPWMVADARLTNIVEDEDGTELEVEGNVVRVRYGNRQIITIKVKPLRAEAPRPSGSNEGREAPRRAG